jgi:hypothetical protein
VFYPSTFSWFYHPNIIWRGEKPWRCSPSSFLQLSVSFFLSLRSQCHHAISKQPQLVFFPDRLTDIINTLHSLLRTDIASRYSGFLWAGLSGDRIPVLATFSTLVQTSPAAHSTSYTMGTGSFPGAKRPGSGINYPTPSIAEVKERVELYFYSPSVPSWQVIGQRLSFIQLTYMLNPLCASFSAGFSRVISTSFAPSPYF